MSEEVKLALQNLEGAIATLKIALGEKPEETPAV